LPENGDILRREAMVNIWHNRGKAIASLGLDRERRVKLLNLLVDQYEAQQDAFDVVRRSGHASDAAISNSISSVNQAAEKDISDFLGQSLYVKFQTATQTEMRETSVAIFLGPQMEMADVPLSPDQLSAMAAIETIDGAAMNSSGMGQDGLSALDDDKLSKAAKILTPQQLAIYQNYLKDQERLSAGHP